MQEGPLAARHVLMAGAGILGGQIIGATDAKGFYAADNVLSLRTSLYPFIKKWASASPDTLPNLRKTGASGRGEETDELFA